MECLASQNVILRNKLTLSVRLGSNGPVQKMVPINYLQVAVKADNLGVFYFACTVPMQALFAEDGSLDKSVLMDYFVNKVISVLCSIFAWSHNGTYIRPRPGVPQFQDPAKVCLNYSN